MEQQSWVKLYDHVSAYNRLVDSEVIQKPSMQVALYERRNDENATFLSMARKDVANGDYFTKVSEMSQFLIEIGAVPEIIHNASGDDIKHRYTSAIGYAYREIYGGRTRIELPSRESIQRFVENYKGDR